MPPFSTLSFPLSKESKEKCQKRYYFPPSEKRLDIECILCNAATMKLQRIFEKNRIYPGHEGKWGTQAFSLKKFPFQRLHHFLKTAGNAHAILLKSSFKISDERKFKQSPSIFLKRIKTVRFSSSNRYKGRWFIEKKKRFKGHFFNGNVGKYRACGEKDHLPMIT